MKENRKEVKTALVATTRPQQLGFLSSYLSDKGFRTRLAINEYETFMRLASERPRLAIIERSLIEKGIAAGLAALAEAEAAETLICLIGEDAGPVNGLKFSRMLDLRENPGASSLDEVLRRLKKSQKAA